jgi:hypothetical protein
MTDPDSTPPESELGPWRPVAAYRLPPVKVSRTRKSLPGQMLFWDREPEPQGPRPARPVCPHCGGIEFDEDGDCTNCLEPGAGPSAK